MLRDFCRSQLATNSIIRFNSKCCSRRQITRTWCREHKNNPMLLSAAIMYNESINVVTHAKRNSSTTTEYNSSGNIYLNDNNQSSEVQNSATNKIKTLSRRLSQRRHSRDNTCGRGQHAQELIKEMKRMTHQNAKKLYDRLMPRDKLDVLRYLAHRSNSRRHKHLSNTTNNGNSGNTLPRYMSKLFNRKYYFKEEDLEEMSTLGHGPGGQATNRRRQSVIVRHIPTNTIVKYSHFTSLQRNRTFAREKLNLLVEEKLLGVNSQLGRLKLLQLKRQRARQVEIERCCAEGIECNARLSQQRQYHAFLTNQVSLPSLVLCELDGALHCKELRIMTLFNEECHNLWQLLFTSFMQANKSSHLHNNLTIEECDVQNGEINRSDSGAEKENVSSNDNSSTCENKLEENAAERNDNNHANKCNSKGKAICNKVNTLLRVPEFIRYLFPLPEVKWQEIIKEHLSKKESVELKPQQEARQTEKEEEQQELESMSQEKSESPSHDDKNVQKNEEWEEQEISKCARDEVAVANVKRMLRCVAELFGLHLREVHKPDNRIKWVLCTDGINWIEMRHRMYTSSHALTPIAQTLWPWIYYSLRHLHLNAEADAVWLFFKRQHRLILQKEEQEQEHHQELNDTSANWAKQMMEML